MCGHYKGDISVRVDFRDFVSHNLVTLLLCCRFVKRRAYFFTDRPERLTIHRIIPLDTPDSLIYLSGSQTFVEILGESLEASGIPRERIIYVYYSGYATL